MRLAALFLLAVPVFAGPITFTFEGTWTHVLPDAIQGVEINEGDPLNGSFTFERIGPSIGDVVGELTFSIGPLLFAPLDFWEDEDGRGHMRGLTAESACSTRFGLLPCMAHVTFREAHLGNWLGIGAVDNEFSVWSLAASNDIDVDPFIPFTVPEPSTLVLLSSALVILWRASRRK